MRSFDLRLLPSQKIVILQIVILQDERYYLCKQEVVNNKDEIEHTDDIDELFFED